MGTAFSSACARRQLFAWLCATRATPVDRPQLSPEQWAWIGETAKAYRLMPILHSRAGEHDSLALPATLADQCSRRYARQRVRWLAMQGGIVRVSGALQDAGIAHVFLKGAALNLATLADPAVRPLRDLDVLVAPADALAARDVLLRLGFGSFPGSVEKSLAHGYQLPALTDDLAGVTVELHHDLAAIAGHNTRPLAEYALDTARLVSLGARRIPVSAPDATLLHLALHAGAKSLFDCGPLLLADASALIEAHGVELEGTGLLAERHGVRPSLAVLIRMLARHGGPVDALKIDRMPCVPEGLVDHAETLLVQPLADVRRREMKRSSQVQGTGRAAFDAVLRAMRPSRRGIAAMAGARSEDRGLWLRYPRWLWRRGMQFATGMGDRELGEEARKDLALARYLVTPEHAGPSK